METLVALAIVLLGAAAFVALGVVLSSREPEQGDRRAGPRRRRWPRVVGGLALVVLGAFVVLGSYVSTVRVCDLPPSRSSWPLESRGNAVAMTSTVLEFESATGGFFNLFCEDEWTLRVGASARPSGRTPLFLGVGGVAATRRYLGARRYDIAATSMSLLETRRAGSRSAGRLAPPASKRFWRSFALSSAQDARGRARLTHEWRAVGGEWLEFGTGTPSSERFWLVVMNADGSPGVAADLRYEVGFAPLDKWPGRIGMLAGLGLAIAGILLAIRRPRSVLRDSGSADRRRGAGHRRAASL